MKTRTPIPDKLAERVMYASDRTCCVCAVRGKHVQIHHIDENPDNNVFENLAVLCTQCHEEAHLRGGSTRRLTSKTVINCRDKWLNRISERRKKSDEMALSMQTGKTSLTQINPVSTGLPEPSKFKLPLVPLINTLPQLKATFSKQLQPKRDTGVTSTILEASNDYINSIVAILIALSNYYSKPPFGNQSPDEYFSDNIATRFQWHRAIAEPDGPGTGGTIVSIFVARSVEEEINKMVEDMVEALLSHDDAFDLPSWRRCWRGDYAENAEDVACENRKNL